MQLNRISSQRDFCVDILIIVRYNINITNSYLLRQERKELFSKRILSKCAHRVRTTVRVIEYVNPPMLPQSAPYLFTVALAMQNTGSALHSWYSTTS